MKQLPRAFELTKLASCTFEKLGLVARLSLSHWGSKQELGIALIIIYGAWAWLKYVLVKPTNC